jgi:SpoVK/Ycf46/Vps4 family AAA+-type ATPase
MWSSCGCIWAGLLADRGRYAEALGHCSAALSQDAGNDPALRRPGRFDRMIFVGLPDADARAGILRSHLKDRPVAGIDLKSIAKRTDGFSGADLAHVCDSATQLAMAESMRSGRVRPVTMADVDEATEQLRPSTGPWFEVARNIVEFANNDGTYDDLAKYLRRRKIR